MFELKLMRYLFNIKNLITKPVNLPRPELVTNVLFRPYSINYKTPTNRSKVFKPTTVAVTNANKHLQIDLTGGDGKSLGRVSMEKAKELAENEELKLVIIDESCSPPKFKLMTGQELFKAQIKIKNEHKNDDNSHKITKEKEIDINLGISEHDLEIKLKMAQSFYEKGHPIKIKVVSKIQNKREKNIPKLQEEFLDKLKSLITFSKFKLEKMNENQILIFIDSKNSN